MSGFRMESDMQNLADMSEDVKVVFLKALVRLAKTDGNFDENEREFVREVALAYAVPASRFDEILNVESDEALLEDVKVIKDRHIAMDLVKEMCMLANTDGDLSDDEVMLIGRVGQAMGLELDKIQQISQWVIDRIVWLEEGKIIFEKF